MNAGSRRSPRRCHWVLDATGSLRSLIVADEAASGPVVPMVFTMPGLLAMRREWLTHRSSDVLREVFDRHPTGASKRCHSLYCVQPAVLRWHARPCRGGANQETGRSGGYAKRDVNGDVAIAAVQLAESRASEGVTPKRRRKALLKCDMLLKPAASAISVTVRRRSAGNCSASRQRWSRRSQM